jgi:formate hydrogenlyase subunit 4
MASRIFLNLLQVIIVMAFSPLALGVLTRLREIIQSKRGPSVLQPYRDLWKLFHKDEVVSEESSWIFSVTPYVVFVAPIFVTLLIPVLTGYPLVFAFMGDMLGAASFWRWEDSLRHSQPSIRPIPTAPWAPAAHAWSAFWQSRSS